MRPLTFCTKFNVQELLFEAFFDIMRIFNNVQLESESTFPPLCNIIFETYQFLSPIATLPGKIDMCNALLFCTKFIAQQLLFETIFDIMLFLAANNYINDDDKIWFNATAESADSTFIF